MEHNGAKWNGTEWNGAEWNGMEQRVHSTVWVFYDGAECIFHSIVWKVDRIE